MPADEVMAEEVIEALEEAYGRHPGQRRNHAKGTCAIGSFTGLPAAAVYSRSPLFSGQPIDVIARFSLAGGNPHAADTEMSTRGLGLEFRLPNGGLQHVTMLNTPMFFGAMPKTFLDKMRALKPNPKTGTADPAKLQAFAASHPDSTAQARFLAENNPPPSYANCAFYSIHTFKFIDAAGKTTLVRWRFQPEDGEEAISNADLTTMPRDFLEQALLDRVAHGPVNWRMMVTIGQPGDPETDPTLPWPADRAEIHAGTLTITQAMPQAGAGAERINFDPLVLGDGIAATDDPILQFRSPSYAISHTRRLRDL
jgi:catalase